MQIPYIQLLKIVKEYSGVDCESESNKRFAQRVLERMFYRGKTDNLSTVRMCVKKGCVTLPEDVQTVLKAKIDCEISNVFSGWYDFTGHNGNQFFDTDFIGFVNVFGTFPTQFDASNEYFYPVVRARGKEAIDARIIIHGIHAETGEKVFIKHKGELNEGEFLPLCGGEFYKASVPLKQITGIEKSLTSDYIDLYADSGTGVLEYLSSYSPKETIPRYKRIRFNPDHCDSDKLYNICLLARLRILSDYHRNELIPVQGTDILESIAQEIRLQKDNMFNEAVVAGNLTKDLIKQEQDYNHNGQDVMNIVQLGDDDTGGVY